MDGGQAGIFRNRRFSAAPSPRESLLMQLGTTLRMMELNDCPCFYPRYAEAKPDSKDTLFLMMGTGNAVLVIKKLTDYLKKRGLPTFEP